MAQVAVVAVTEALFAPVREAPGPTVPPQPRGYRIDAARDYEVRWGHPAELVGHCHARMTEDGRAVRLELTDFEIQFPLEDVRWRPTFVIRADGLAQLEAVFAHPA